MNEELLLNFIKSTLLERGNNWKYEVNVPPYTIKDLTNDIYTSFVATIKDGLFDDTEVHLRDIGSFLRDADYNITFEASSRIQEILKQKKDVEYNNQEPLNAKKQIEAYLEMYLGETSDEIQSKFLDNNETDKKLLDITALKVYDAFVKSFSDMIKDMGCSAVAEDLGIFSIKPPHFRPHTSFNYNIPFE